ncbi:MAG: tRNA preQ1(34) S-adenosylmethionine ribosyltransferase-isomerase QueA [Desulfoprunum sp.]|uniref:tRNA preQ1(34) S-adenosylmethionine ribosyltransferase-isomerase QueA n=1 Tax=Desulfoprunum sp. TaxID=2020866 RepID=UPI0026823B6F
MPGLRPRLAEAAETEATSISSLTTENNTHMQQDFILSAYDYHLPAERIAQHPADRRDNSRLLVLDNESKAISHRRFADIVDLMNDGDMLVVNDTRVFPARLQGRKDSGGKIEVFLLEFPARVDGSSAGPARATALLRCSKRPQPGSRLLLDGGPVCTVIELLADGKARLEMQFGEGEDIAQALSACGQVPLPPYILRQEGTTAADRERYQTVYAHRPGAVAAPTAGLHFTEALLQRLKDKGVQLATITLHVGYGTFAPVRTEEIRDHRIHAEYIEVPAATMAMIATTRQNGGRIWAVGTTTVRALEFAARQCHGTPAAVEGWCDLYIYPGFAFKVVDCLITNFHLPNSSLMFLVAALCGRETLLLCYETAVREGYRFYSYGDAMAVVTAKATASAG